ncbi:MAG: MFS transporter [Holophaga sp.]|nr:MFS transporter [Holophaga sp.]
MFGTSIPINMLKTYAAIYYIDRLGLTTTQFALILSIYTIVDALDNPIYGFLSDRTRTRWGRRRPWMVGGTILMVLSFIAFFSSLAQAASGFLFMYCLLFYSLTGTLDSVINANYGALFPELFRTDAARASTNALRQAFQLMAMIISIALTPQVTKALGYQMTAVVYGILGGAVILYMAFTSQEAPIEDSEAKPQLWDSIKSLLVNQVLDRRFRQCFTAPECHWCWLRCHFL